MKSHGTSRRFLISAAATLVATTIIGAFSLAGCGGAGGTYSPHVQGANTPPPDFSISVGEVSQKSVGAVSNSSLSSSQLVAPAASRSLTRSITVTPGVTAHFSVTVTALYGFSAPVTLSLSGAPTGATTVFGTTSITPTAAGVTTTVDVTPPAVGSAGTFTITLTGTAGTTSHMATDTLIVTANPDFTIALTPSTATVVQGGTANYTVTLTSIGGFDTSTVVLALPTGLPSSSGASFGSPTVTATGRTVPLSIMTSHDSRTPPGTSAISLTGTAGTLSHSASGTVAVSGYTITVTEATPGSGSIFAPPPPETAQFIVTVTSVNGYSQPITLHNSYISDGATVVFGSTTITPTAAGATTTLSITPANSTAPGSYPFTVTGYGNGDSTGAIGSATMALKGT